MYVEYLMFGFILTVRTNARIWCAWEVNIEYNNVLLERVKRYFLHVTT